MRPSEKNRRRREKRRQLENKMALLTLLGQCRTDAMLAAWPGTPWDKETTESAARALLSGITKLHTELA